MRRRTEPGEDGGEGSASESEPVAGERSGGSRRLRSGVEVVVGWECGARSGFSWGPVVALPFFLFPIAGGSGGEGR